MEKILIYDIETNTENRKLPDPEKDKLVVVGFRHPNGKKEAFWYPQQKGLIQAMLNRYKYISGHNIQKRMGKYGLMGYDNIVMQKHDFKFRNDVVFIDTQRILENRAKSMLYMDFPSFKLGEVAEFLNLPSLKGELDYNILKQKTISQKDKQLILEYLNADLETTYHLLKWLHDTFKGLFDYFSKEDKESFAWLTTSAGKSAYKVFCNITGNNEIYNKQYVEKDYEGAYIGTFSKRSAKDVVVIDFSSMYPHMMIGGNLFSRTNDKTAWHGGGVYESAKDNPRDGVKGYYKREQGVFEKFLQDLFYKRTEYKKEMKKHQKGTQEYLDCYSKQLACKILLNSSYGASGCPLFKNMFDLISASDITAMSRQTNKQLKKVCEKYGFVSYLHTDSVHVSLNDMNDLDNLKKDILELVEKQKQSFNIYTPTHNAEIEEILAYEYYFQSDDETLCKARNLAIKQDGSWSMTGGKMIRKDTSKIAKRIFEKYLLPELVKGRDNLFFDLDELKRHVLKEVEGNPKELLKRFKIRPPEHYNTKTSIHYSISEMYYDKANDLGEIYLINNKHIGAGKESRYAMLQEMQDKFGDNWWRQANLNTILGDLSDFVSPKDRKRIVKTNFNQVVSLKSFFN